VNPFSFTLLALFAIAQNVDNFVLAGAYRLKNVRIPRGPNVLIAILSGLATMSAAGVGWAFGETVADKGHWVVLNSIARGLLIMLGVWTIVGYFWKKLFPQLRQLDGDKSLADLNASVEGPSVPIHSTEAIVVATALAIDNLAPSFAFGVRHPRYSFASLLVLALLTATFSVMLVILGQYAGRRKKLRFQHPLRHFVSPELVSGCLIIVIALFDPGDFAHDLMER
jgi:putative Mn2+ efflux pump MntP